MSTPFTYTDEEKDHLRGLIQCCFLDKFAPENRDPGYWRYITQLERDEPGPYADAENGPDPSDCWPDPTAEDLEEIAEELECGM